VMRQTANIRRGMGERRLRLLDDLAGENGLRCASQGNGGARSFDVCPGDGIGHALV
jgi:hypothetical protein